MSVPLLKLDPVQQKLWDGFICYERKRGIKNIDTGGVRNLVRFIEFMNKRGLKTSDIGVREAGEFEVYLQTVKTEGYGRTLSEGSRKAIISTTKRFFNYLLKRGMVSQNPFAVTEKNREQARKKQELACYDRYHLQDFLEHERQKGFRNPERVRRGLIKLFVFLEESGCNPQELEAGSYRGWLASLKMKNGKPYNRFTLRIYYVTAKKYCTYLQERGLLKANPLELKTAAVRKTGSRYYGLVKGFEDYCRLKGKRPRTITGWKFCLKKLFTFLEEQELDFGQVKVTTAQEFQGWVAALGETQQGGYAEGTIIGYITAAVAFFDYLKYKKLILTNPFKEIRRLRERKKLPRGVLKENEMNRLLKAFAEFDREENLNKRKSLYRLHVVAELMYSTGMRIDEAAGIVLTDIDFSAGTILLRETKDRKERIVFLNEYAREVLRLYVEELHPLILNAKADRKKLFGCSGRVLNQLFNKELKVVALKTGLPVITSKSFRHAFGYHFLRAGCNMRYIQAFLGHAKLTSTEKYTKVDKEDLRTIIDTYHPRKWKGRK